MKISLELSPYCEKSLCFVLCGTGRRRNSPPGIQINIHQRDIHIQAFLKPLGIHS